MLSGQEARQQIAVGLARPLGRIGCAYTVYRLLTRRGTQTLSRDLHLDQVPSWLNTLDAFERRRILAMLARMNGPQGGCPLPRGELPLLMGIINVTPDSFSDAGDHEAPREAIRQGRRLLEEGADILDIGGESTRPGARPVAPQEEVRRVEPVLRGLADSGATLSIDTRHAQTMRAALAAGATVINDVSALRDDPESLPLAAGSTAKVVLMHRQGEPADMNCSPGYDDVLLDVYDFLEARVEACCMAGLDRSRLIIDPGIGFGKKSQHNLSLLRGLALFHGLGCPILLGVSRKGLTGAQERQCAPKARWPGSLAAVLWALSRGVQILRVHDVAKTRQAVEIWQAITR